MTNKKIKGKKSLSNCYLRFPIDKIYKYNPNITLILLLRETIARVHSHYNMELKRRKDYKKSHIWMNLINKKNIKLKNIIIMVIIM